MPAVSIRDLVKRYGDVKAVDGISMEIEEGEVFGILGPNGSGKTTTLEMVETLREPDAGEIEVLGIDARKHPNTQWGQPPNFKKWCQASTSSGIVRRVIVRMVIVRGVRPGHRTEPRRARNERIALFTKAPQARSEA